MTVGRADVDEARKSLTRTRGVFVTRAASEALGRQTSVAAQRSAQAEAASPERVAAARENAREALAAVLRGPLTAAGLGDVRVEVRFPSDPESATERWDTSRSLREVLGDAK